MINKTKNNKNWLWIIASQIIILSVCIVNVFPRGYTFAGGDVFQFINLSSILKNMNYLWSNNLGEGMFLQNFSYSAYYHVIQFVSNLFKLAPSNQSFVYYFIFLFGSFWAFFLSIRFFQKHDQADSVSVDVKVIFSLLYTFNVYVFYNFFYIWGISPFLFLYILLPPIFGLTYAYFSDRESNRASQIKLLAWLVVMFVLTISQTETWHFASHLIYFYFFLYFCIGYSITNNISSGCMQRGQLYTMLSICFPSVGRYYRKLLR